MKSSMETVVANYVAAMLLRPEIKSVEVDWIEDADHEGDLLGDVSMEVCPIVPINFIKCSLVVGNEESKDGR